MVSIQRAALLVSMFAMVPVITACDLSVQASLQGAEAEGLPVPDGIDPYKPNVERRTQSVEFEDIRTIRIEVPTGRVTVTQEAGEARASLKVTETIILPGLGVDDLRRLLTESRVTAEPSFVDETRLDVEATPAAGLDDADIAFDVKLTIPHGANIEILVDNGPVEVVDVTGNVEIRTNNGAVVVDHVSGSVVARTSNRPVDVVDVTGNVQVETSDAKVTLRLVPPEGGIVSATTANASIRLTVPTTTSAALSLKAADGTVSANLNGFEVSDVITASGFLSGTLSDGAGQIEARTTGGDITFVGM